MAKSQDLPIIFNEAQKSLIEGKTPARFIKARKGPKGLVLNYVEIGYINDQLNKLTGFRWSFEIVDQKVGMEQIWVKGKLTVPTPEGDIVKEQYGSKRIAVYKENRKPIDIGGDLKAAASDALKKCASLLGIASDVYWPQGEEMETETLSEENIVDIDEAVNAIK